MKAKRSLRSKLLSLLVGLPLVSLVAYLAMASQVFVKDKIAYVFDSTAQNAGVLANQVKMSMASFQNVLRPVLGAAELGDAKFGTEAQARFQNQKLIEHLALYKSTPEGLAAADSLVLFPREVERFEIDPATFGALVRLASKQGSAIADFKAKARFFVYLQKLEGTSAEGDLFALALFKMPDLYEAFATPGIFESYLVSRSGVISFSPKYWRASKLSDLVVDPKVFAKALESKAPQGVFERKFANGKDMLVSFAETKVGDYLAVSVVDKTQALDAFRKLLLKSAIFLLCVLSAIVMIGLVASLNLTTTLAKLVEMAAQIAKGNFGYRAKIDSDDETGVVAESFVAMATEVTRMFNAKAEQARLESELEMVSTIQANLFPKRVEKFGDFRIECHFESASEAGGDWFHYAVVDEKLFLWIGDATGHGAPAALITAAAKATSAVLESGVVAMTPSSMLKVMNRAINATSKGSVLMTFFLAAIDLKTGKGVYSNASHEQPFLIPRKEKVTKADLTFLLDARGPRLGDDVGAEYQEAEFQMEPGDTIVMYTDGAFDLENREKKQLGEKGFLRLVTKAASGKANVEQITREMRLNMETHRDGAPLVDDMMIIVCQYDPLKRGLQESA